MTVALSDLKKSRFHGLLEQIDWLLWKFHDTKKLSTPQIKQLKECANTILCFGELGKEVYNEAIQVINKLSKNGRKENQSKD